MTPDRVREIARKEVEIGWEQVGVNVTDTDGRLGHAALIAWMRERKRLAESSSNQIRLTMIGGAITVILTSIGTWLAAFGFHK